MQLVLFIFILSVEAFAERQYFGQYTIVGSRVIRSNSNYHVAVSVHNATEAATVRLTIENGGDFKLVKTINVQPWSTESVAFEFGVLPPPPSGHNYTLTADGLLGLRFHNVTELRVNEKHFHILVQTDKAVYNVGDLIRFRALIIDVETRPVELLETLQVHVEDGAGNRVKHWTNQSTTNGVYSGAIRLADELVLGEWSLIFNANNETSRHTVSVVDNTPPAFEVTIETASNVLYNSGKIYANIYGKHTNDQPVHGEAIATLGSEFNWFHNLPMASKTIKVGRRGAVEFDIEDDLQLPDKTIQVLAMQVSLTEELTGRQQNVTTTIYLRRNRFDILRTTLNTQYVEGQTFDLELLVKRFDGTPAWNETIEVWYSSDISLTGSDTFSQEHRVDSNGLVKAELNFPLNRRGYFILAKCQDVTTGFDYLEVSYSKYVYVGEFDVSGPTTKAGVGDTVTLELQSRLPLYNYTYQLFGRGDILLTKTEQTKNATQEFYAIEFVATFDMLPTAYIVVYTFRADGTTAIANHEIYLESNLRNTINLEPSVNDAVTGSEIDLKIKTPAKSLVGLLGVDQRVRMLRAGNDLTVDRVTSSQQLFGVEQFTLTFGSILDHFFNPKAWLENVSKFESVDAFVFSNVQDLITVNIDGVYPPTKHLSSDQNSFEDILPTMRTNFADTWIWDTFFINNDEEVQHFHVKVPDTITSWVITAFSLNSESGLGLTKDSSKISVFKTFFVSLSLPCSVKRGEVVSVPIDVFNNLDTSLITVVTLVNEFGEFEFVEIGNDGEEIADMGQQSSETVLINSMDAARVSFMIKPLKVGPLTINVAAVSPMAGDRIKHILAVSPEGVPQYVNKAVLVDLREKQSQEISIPIVVPVDAVPDSTHIEVSAIGDVMGSAITHLDSLILLPTGCGEQNMLNIVPHIVILNYLKSVNQLTEEVKLKSHHYMELSYQRQLTNRHLNGSFSAFGKSDASGSTWLTAFVARSFRQAADHIDIIDDRIIYEALDFLRNVQSENGSFSEVGTCIHRQMQSGAGQGVALTAYTLLAFLENQHTFPEFSNVIEKATDYVAKNLDTLTDVYAMAVAAYALQLADHSAKDEVLRILDAKAIVNGDRIHWEQQIAGEDVTNSSVNTEITSYALLAHFHAGTADRFVPIMKWLLAQRNAHGGFASTQDTIIGLQALATIAARIGFGDGDVEYTLSSGEKAQSSVFSVNAANAQVLQQYQLPGDTREVNVTATGHGFSLLSLAYKYYVNATGAEPRFNVHPEVIKSASVNSLQLNVCTSFIPSEETSVSNMAVMEIQFPSGFTFDTERLSALKSAPHVKKAELRNVDTVVVLYFDNLGSEPVCQRIEAVRTHRVAHLKPTAITVFDYYDTARKTRVFYETVETGLCDICAQNCPDCCNSIL